MPDERMNGMDCPPGGGWVSGHSRVGRVGWVDGWLSLVERGGGVGDEVR